MVRSISLSDKTVRRMAIARGRARRTLPGSGPAHRSVFMHMPKCGGTSLSEAMYATVPFSRRVGVIDALSTRRAAAMVRFGKDDLTTCHEDLEHGQATFDFRECLLLQHMAWDTALIHGHVLWSEAARSFFPGRYKYVTLLREPVARTISNMRMAQRNGLTGPDITIVGPDIDAYLEGPIARRHASVFLRYLAGRNDIADDEVPGALDMAMHRLGELDLVGFLEDLPSFFSAYRKLFGVPLRMSQLNAAPSGKPDYTEAQMSKFRALCAPDIALYEAARNGTVAGRLAAG